MDYVPRKVITTVTTIRLETPGKVDRKHLSYVLALLEQEFANANARRPEYDNDWWLEPTDEGIAFCFIKKDREEF